MVRLIHCAKALCGRVAAVSLLALTAGAGACVNDAYDLNDISLKMTLGPDGVVMPLGNMKEQSIKKLLDDSGVDTLKLDTDDGYYAYRVEDAISESIDGIDVKPVERVMPEFEPATVQLNDIGIPGLGKAELTLRGEFAFDEQLNETFELPDEVSSIAFASVYDATSPVVDDQFPTAEIVVLFDIENMPFDQCVFENIRISLPEFIEIDDERFDPATHTVLVDRVEYVGRETEIVRLKVVGISDVPVVSEAAGKVGQLTGNVQLNAEIEVAGPSDVSETVVVVRPVVTMPPLGVRQLTGRFDVDLNKYLEPTTVDLGDLGGLSGDDGLEINLVAPQIKLSVNNPMGIAMVGDVILQAYDQEDAPIDPVVVPDVRIEPADGDQPRMTKLYITDQSEAPTGYTLCKVDNLSDLVRMVPSRVEIRFDLGTDPQEEQHLLISSDPYQLDVDYLVRLPLAFREGAVIDYTMTQDVSDTFSEIEKYQVEAEDILIRFDARSSLPLTLDLSAELLTAEGTPVENVTSEVEGQIEGVDPTTGSGVRESQLALTLQFTDGNLNHLQEIDQIRLRFRGSALGAEAALTPEQFVAAKLTLVLRKGISLDADKLNK